ncbi:hypothetical protein Hanom_Chr06g00518611 [Helianthus anomalus]
MRKQTNGGRLFKLNFLAYWNTLFVEITKSTTVKQSFLLAIDKEEDISKLDRCSFLLYNNDYNKRHQLFNEVVELPIIKYITSGMIDDVEEYIYNNGPLSDDQQHATASDNIITNDHQNEQAPTTPLENINQQTSTLLTDLFNDNIPLHKNVAVQENLIALETIDQPMTDWFEGWNPSDDISELNLVMGIGSQTQKIIDYCSTSLQLTGVIYDDGTREASNKNKNVHSFEFKK